MDYEDIEMSLARRIDTNEDVIKKLHSFSHRIVDSINNKLAIYHHHGRFDVTYVEPAKQNGEYIGELEFIYSLSFSLKGKNQTIEVVVCLADNGSDQPDASIDGDNVTELQSANYINTISDRVIELLSEKAEQY
ncbi:hypothetical protein RGO69_001172 [Morganella morganii]|nr:hypothetical protein [Morganella morganii]